MMAQKNYDCPVKDFGISKIELQKVDTHNSQSKSLEIIVIINGELSIEGTNALAAAKGEVIAILPGENYTISTQSDLIAYKAFVP